MTTNPGLRAEEQRAEDQRLTPAGRRAVFAAVLGTVIEWYDYALYGAAAGLVIAPLFFSDAVSSAAAMMAFATFAVGFVARPLGGVIVGHIGDKYGRRPAMMLTIILMGVATVGVGLLPTSAAIGAAAPLLLVILRLLQGFGAGAELAGAMTLVAEFAPPKRRGFYTSLVLSTPPAGIALATFAFFAVSSLGTEALLGWAWRIPFLVSAVLFLLALYIRNRLEETPEYSRAIEKAAAERTKARLPLRDVLARDWRQVLIGFFSITGHNAMNYILAVYALSLMTSPLVGLAKSDALLAVTLGSLVSVALTPVGGRLSDRFGAAKVLLFGSVMGAALAYPIFGLLSAGSFALAFTAIALGYGLVIPATSGAQGAFLTNLFPPQRRLSGIGVARETNGAVVAGLSPLIAAALVNAADGSTHLAAGYLLACCLLSAIAVLLSLRVPANH
ncbi:MFS transporter [Paeniglutamicibacter sp. ABSL32-1]|uniref:MFS transporter n=1 Tax=Paeniglutamicibacter quisquiliarum TaxID=2849498 RepID=UPI001C2CDC0C|nr:MFS transporter [Paeniglutamicibacter quisquiliarum]MBV1777497.1 MFS transporter [Paeniglutamicibacter quisquiliarum]